MYTMPMPSPSLAIVIVNYNTWDLLVRCLDSVLANVCRCSISIFVVDNDSRDGSAALVRERFPSVHLLQSDRNGGYGYANNLALRAIAGLARDPSAPRQQGPAPG